MRGIYLDGIVLDEYADMDPRVWSEIIRPALADRIGWAVFIGTPRGRNNFFELWRRAQADPTWFAMMLKASETGLIAASELALARTDLTEEEYAEVKAGEERAMLMKQEADSLAHELAELKRYEREEAAQEIVRAQRRAAGECEVCGTRLNLARRFAHRPRCKAHRLSVGFLEGASNPDRLV